MKIRCWDIVWDTDGEDADLPREVVIEVDDEVWAEGSVTAEEAVSGALSDKYGWCHTGFNYEAVKETL